MKAAEILRKFADLLDQHESDQETPTNQATLIPVSADNTDDTEVTTMVPPLQQKLELMKKMVGDESSCDSDGSDELSIMKKNAGINPVIVAMADEDEPFEG